MTVWELRTYPLDVTLEEGFERSYAWEYDGRTFTWELCLPKQLYRARGARYRIYDYGAYVADDLTRQTFKSFCNELRSYSKALQLSQRETVAFVARFVQQLEYTPDYISTDHSNYPRYPIETLVDETGDCEDSSILLGVLLYGLGFRVGFLEFDSHLGVGVVLADGPDNFEFEDVTYTYVEPTDSGWSVGEVPERYQGQPASLHPVGDSPVIHAVWRAKRSGDAVTCTGSLLNTGEEKARTVGLHLAFANATGDTVGSLWREWVRIEPGETVSWTDSIGTDDRRPLEASWTLSIDSVVHDRGTVDGTTG